MRKKDSRRNIRMNRLKDELFRLSGIIFTAFGLTMLAVFLASILIEGVPRLDWQFIISLPSRKPENAGILIPLVGTMFIMVLTALISIPLGVAAGVYLEEYGGKGFFSKLVEVNMMNLAGVPSIIYGLLALEMFVRLMGLGKSLLAGSMTLSLLIFPVIVVATREALKAVPRTIREASYAMGASKWQTTWYQVLPASSGGIVTGVILAISRAIGETAPLIVIGAMLYITTIPTSPMDDFAVLPIQIFNWLSRPQKGFIINATAAIVILLAFTFTLNGIAVYLRDRWQKRSSW